MQSCNCCLARRCVNIWWMSQSNVRTYTALAHIHLQEPKETFDLEKVRETYMQIYERNFKAAS